MERTRRLDRSKKDARKAAAAAALLVLSGCSGQQLFSIDDLTKRANVGFLGCITGTGLSVSSVLLSYSVPTGATSFAIRRGGVIVHTTSAVGEGEFIDTGLAEGHTYSYTCEAMINGELKIGSRALQLSTRAVNAPTFSGITGVTSVSPTVARVAWAAASSSGVPAAKYRVYATLGTVVDWTADPVAEVSAGTFSADVSSRYEEVPFAYGVRACTADGICDVNTVEIVAATQDGGAPKSAGATGGFVRDGKVVLTVPWVPSDGGLLRRKVYHRADTSGGTTLSNYALYQTAFVADASAPPLEIEVEGLAQFKTHYFIVIDEDPSGNSTQPHVPVSIAVTDLTVPVFTGASAVNLSSPAESAVSVTFTAIARESVEDALAGASEYRLYSRSAPYPETAPAACSGGTLHSSYPAAGYAPGQSYLIAVEDLHPRTSYSFCLKARDSTGNESLTTASFSVLTLDETPPEFDGATEITLNAAERTLTIGWNPSPSVDVDSYVVKLWKNVANPDPEDVAIFSRAHLEFPDGATFTRSDFDFGDNDTVYAIVEACDDAGNLPGGAPNCTDTPNGSARVEALPDFLPPPAFAGIKGDEFQESPAEAQLTVRWHEPPDWTDYAGFRVYSIEEGGTLALLETCVCPAGNCTSPSPYTECTFGGVDAYRTYKLHVRGIDAAGNETVLDPALSHASVRTIDNTAPSFVSAIQIGAGPEYRISYTAATDNQYSGEPGAAITYRIYGKEGSTFGDPEDPEEDGSLRGETTATSFVDPSLVEGKTYYFTVCASDASGHTTCDGAVASVFVADASPPTIVNFTSNDKTDKSKRWTLSWTMSDNLTATVALKVRIYRSASATPGTATASDTLIADLTGATSYQVSGPPNQDTWVNFMIEVEDAAGLKSTAHYSTYSRNVLSVSSIGRTTGPSAGGNLVLIKGHGFANPSDSGYGTPPTVTIGGASCTSVKVYSDKRISCVTGAAAPGLSDVIVTNPEGSSATLEDAYTYESSPTHVCDNPGSWGAEFAGGTGAQGDPFVICDYGQFNRLRMNIADGATLQYRTGGYHYLLGNPIDLDGSGFVPITGGVIMTIDGGGLAVMNFTHVGGPTEDSVGLFRYGTLVAKDVDFLNFNVSGRYYVGAVLGNVDNTGNAVRVENSFITATGTASEQLGAVFGRAYQAGPVLSNITAEVEMTATDAGYVGGLTGYADGPVQILDSHVSGQVNGGPNYFVGGVSGYIRGVGGLVKNVTSEVNIVARQSYVGGIVGYSAVNLENVTAKGEIVDVNNQFSYYGGIVGQLYQAKVTGARFYGEVRAVNYVGGIVGQATYGQIADSVNYGVVTGSTLTSGSGAGGVAGYVQCSDIERSGNEGQVTGWTYVGGVVGLYYYWTGATCGTQAGGYGYRTVRESYSAGPVNGRSTVGALIGRIHLNNVNGGDARFTDNYTTSPVNGIVTYFSGVIGDMVFGPDGIGLFQASFERIYSVAPINPGMGAMGTARATFVQLCTDCNLPPAVSGVILDPARIGASVTYSNAGSGGLTSSGFINSDEAAMTNRNPGNVFETAGYDFVNTWKWPSTPGGTPILKWQTE